jgi:hypothetical protein
MAQLAIVNATKFAGGGYSGHGYGRVDETGKRQAGIVHQREFVFNEMATDGNVSKFYAMQQALASGKSFASFAIDYLSGNIRRIALPSPSHSFASGGYAQEAMNTGVGINIISILIGQQNEFFVEMNNKLNSIEYYNSETSENTNKLKKQRNRY